jgi:hypothetical protein
MRFFILFLALASFAFAEDKPEPKSPASILVDKAIAENSKDAEKAYLAYQKALEVANSKIIKALEVAKVDLNDPKKGKLSITERARALEEIDEKIKGLKGGELATMLADKTKEEEKALAEKKKEEKVKEKVVASKPDPKAPIIGKWSHTSTDATGKTISLIYEFFKDGTGLADGYWKLKWELKSGDVYIVNNITQSLVDEFKIGFGGKEGTRSRATRPDWYVTYLRVDDVSKSTK